MCSISGKKLLFFKNFRSHLRREKVERISKLAKKFSSLQTTISEKRDSRWGNIFTQPDYISICKYSTQSFDEITPTVLAGKLHARHFLHQDITSSSPQKKVKLEWEGSSEEENEQCPAARQRIIQQHPSNKSTTETESAAVAAFSLPPPRTVKHRPDRRIKALEKSRNICNFPFTSLYTIVEEEAEGNAPSQM